jgi:hypothetical protein
MITKTEKLSKQQLIRNLQSSNIAKIEVIEGFKKYDEIKKLLDGFGGGLGVSVIMVKER